MRTNSAKASFGNAHSPFEACLKTGLALLACVPLICQAGEPCSPGVGDKTIAGEQQMTPPTPPNVAKLAMGAAVADGVSTGFALASGAVEANPLVSPTPLGLLALTGVKVAVVNYANRLPEDQKRTALKTSTAVWGGAAVNNLLVLAAVSPPFPIIAGLVMGYLGWRQMSQRYEEYDRVVALQAKQHSVNTLTACNSEPAPAPAQVPAPEVAQAQAPAQQVAAVE
jgi:hypothetical protein